MVFFVLPDTQNPFGRRSTTSSTVSPTRTCASTASSPTSPPGASSSPTSTLSPLLSRQLHQRLHFHVRPRVPRARDYPFPRPLRPSRPPGGSGGVARGRRALWPHRRALLLPLAARNALVSAPPAVLRVGKSRVALSPSRRWRATQRYCRDWSRRPSSPSSTYHWSSAPTQDIILFDWNPLSVREAAALQRLLGELAGFFTTVTEELRAVYRSVATRISDCMNASVWCVCSLTSEKTGDVQVDAQEVVELYLTRGIRVGFVRLIDSSFWK